MQLALAQKIELRLGMEMEDDVTRRARGAYLGLAIGDALGATVEFMTPREIQSTYGTHREIVGGGWLRLRSGHVTDDTEMSLALGNAILAHGRVVPEAVAEAFSEWMRSKPVDIGNTVRRGILHYRNTGVADVPENAHDAGNGACMRSLPVALQSLGATADEVSDALRAQAHTTHNNRLSDAGTRCVVLMVQAALRGADKGELAYYIEVLEKTWPEFRLGTRRVENPSAYIVDTLKAVFQAFLHGSDFETSLVDAVNRGGDADTTGAILGMIAGALYGPESIPSRWLKRLEVGVRSACERQAEALLQLSPLARPPIKRGGRA